MKMMVRIDVVFYTCTRKGKGILGRGLVSVKQGFVKIIRHQL